MGAGGGNTGFSGSNGETIVGVTSIATAPPVVSGAASGGGASARQPCLHFAQVTCRGPAAKRLAATKKRVWQKGQAMIMLMLIESNQWVSKPLYKVCFYHLAYMHIYKM